MRFAADLRDNIAAGDANYLTLLDEADAYIALNGLDLPEEPEARVLGPDPDCVTNPLLELDLAGAGVTTIIWATGYVTDFGWLKVDAFDGNGRPRHQRGVSTEPGVYFLGLPWLSRRGSSFIWGVWHDARYIADQISIQRGYAAYRSLTPPPGIAPSAGPQAGARTVRKEVSPSPAATSANMPAARRRAGRIPQSSARRPASGAATTITARLRDRMVMMVRAWSSSGVTSWR